MRIGTEKLIQTETRKAKKKNSLVMVVLKRISSLVDEALTFDLKAGPSKESARQGL